MTNIKKTKKGFTLMEVVTVVAIIAIVSTAGVVGVAVTLNNASNTQTRLATENGYNFEAEARNAVRNIVPLGGHANVEYYTPDDGEPNTEPAGDNNPATPIDGTPAPGGEGDGGGGGGVVIPADGGSANGGSSTPADDPVEPAAEPEDPDPVDPEDPDPVVPEDDTTPVVNGGDGKPAEGTSVSRSSGSGYDYWENGHIVGYYHQNQGTISFPNGVQSAIIVVPEGSRGFSVNNDGKYTVTPLGDNRYQVDFTATWQTNKDTTLRVSHDYLGANNTDYGMDQIYVESYTT